MEEEGVTSSVDGGKVREYIEKEVGDWEDELASRARFKDFSGQASDWVDSPLFHFWRNLILNISLHFHLLFLRPSQLRKEWFNRGGLSPLCIEDVLGLMHKQGDILRSDQLLDPTTPSPRLSLSLLFRKLSNLFFSTTNYEDDDDDLVYIVMPVLKEKAAGALNLLAQQQNEYYSNSNSNATIITMDRFQNICGSPASASAILSYLSSQSQARFLSLNTGQGHLIQGVKIALSSASASPVSSVSSFDCDVLHLISTTETLHQQLSLIHKRCQRSKKSALASLASGNKNEALRHLRALKLANQSRDKCASLLNRVEELLLLIANAESNNKVSEAIQIGAQALKQNNISVKQVEQSLQQLEESIDLQKQVENALESTPSYAFVDDEDIEEEFKKLELEIGSGKNTHRPIPEAKAVAAAIESGPLDSTESLSEAFSNLKFVDGPSNTAAAQGIIACHSLVRICKVLELVMQLYQQV